ncbi:MAG: hypothetical protein JKY37_15265 [Nannocystaceae bacterium]|nr:hypothetical protein [Nannocystaceae bacterium]
MQRPLSTILALAPLLFASCFTPGDTCPVHCWQHDSTWAIAPLNPDLSPSSQDLECDDAVTNDEIDLSLIPELASMDFNGVTCPQTQADHDTITMMVNAIGAGTGAAQAGADIQTYQDFVDALTLAARNACSQALTASDIDPGTPGLQTCSQLTAIDVCNAYILYPLRAELGDLNAGTSYDPPQGAPPDLKSIAAGEVCDYSPGLGQATGGEDDGTPDGTTGGGEEDDGVDETTGAPVVDPFGDIGTLVWCNQAGTECTYEDELVQNISANFSVFYEEGVTLTLIPPGKPDYPGATVYGLDSGEASDDLASAFGLRNNDIIKSINGIKLFDESDGLEAIDSMLNSETIVIGIGRRGRPTFYKVVEPA